MIRFESDYLEGAHPKILDALVKTNMVQTSGYGKDHFCEQAKALIKEKCEAPEADVHFLVGGTQTNKTVITSILRPYQGVLSPDTGHIQTHETGTIERSGHKILTLPNIEGKITAKHVQDVCELHFNLETPEHMTQPGMVYISHPTEIGTLYTKKELEDLRAICDTYELPLFLDGARLSYGLTASQTDVTLADISRLCDVFYIGGTKCGTLFGEAVVITNKALQKDFLYHIKQNGGLLAKGRLLGLQFYALFEDDLHLEITKQANDLSLRIHDAFKKKGYEFLINSVTNQQFPIIPDDKLEILKQKYSYTYWKRMNETHSAVRFCTSWATLPEYVDALVADIESL